MSDTPKRLPDNFRPDFPVPLRQSDSNAIYHNSADITSWLDRLPIANTLETGKLLFKSLFEMNRLEMTNEQRVEIMEKYLALVDSVTESLKRFYTNAAFPLSEKSHKIALLTREIIKEIAIGYKITVNALLENQATPVDRNLLTICLHRTIYYLGQSIYQSSIIYEPYPANIWREVHSIFSFSSRIKADQTLVSQTLNDEQENSTISQQYKKILLFSLASPYQMRQRDIHNLFQYLPQWVDMARLSVIPADNKTADNFFIVNLMSDAAPLHASIYAEKITPHCIAVKTETLLKHLSQIQEDQQSEFRLSFNLRHLLMQNWSHAQQRRYVRTKLNFQLQIAVGLPLIHELIQSGTAAIASQRDSFSDNLRPGNQKKPAKSNNIFLTDGEQNSDFSGLALQPHMDVTYKNSMTSATQANSPAINFVGQPVRQEQKKQPVPESKTTESCTTVNESTGGYCIEWNHRQAPGIKVGELIGIQSTSSDAEFGLAITKWLKYIPGNNLLAGIHLITHHCHATQVRLGKTLPKHKRPDWYAGLLIPATISSAETIITPADLFSTGDFLYIKDQQNNETRIRLKQLTESTGLFSQYIIAHEPDATTGSPGARSGMEKNWSGF